MFNLKRLFWASKEPLSPEPIIPAPLPIIDFLPFVRPVKGQPLENAYWWNSPVNITHKDAEQFGCEYAMLLIHYLKTGGNLNSLFWCVRDMPRGNLLGKLEREFFRELSHQLR